MSYGILVMFVDFPLLTTVLNKNNNYANVKGHLLTNSLELQSSIFQNLINNPTYPLINKIVQIIKNEKLENNYIENKTKIIDICTYNSNHFLKKKNKQFIVAYKKKIENIIKSKQLLSIIKYDEIK